MLRPRRSPCTCSVTLGMILLLLTEANEGPYLAATRAAADPPLKCIVSAAVLPRAAPGPSA